MVDGVATAKLLQHAKSSQMRTMSITSSDTARELSVVLDKVSGPILVSDSTRADGGSLVVTTYNDWLAEAGLSSHVVPLLQGLSLQADLFHRLIQSTLHLSCTSRCSKQSGGLLETWLMD